MGHLVMKIAPDEDLYVIWSSIVEAPVMWGTAAEVVAELIEIDHEKEQYARPRIEAAMKRADQHGASGMRLTGRWDDNGHGLIFEQRGVLPRANLRAFLASFDEATDRFDLSLLEPFDDETAVRGYTEGGA